MQRAIRKMYAERVRSMEIQSCSSSLASFSLFPKMILFG